MTRQVLDLLLDADWRKVSVRRRRGRCCLELSFGSNGDLSYCLRVPLSDLDIDRLREGLKPDAQHADP